MVGSAHIDLFSAAAKLRFDASLNARIANRIFRLAFAIVLLSGGALSLATALYGAPAFLKLIFQNIKIVLA